MRTCILSMVLVFGFTAGAAVPKRSMPKAALKPIELTPSQEVTATALRLPLEQRIDALKIRGDKSLKDLKAIARNEQAPLSLRWKSVTALGRVFPIESKDLLLSLTKNKEWYLRNASLIALKAAYRPFALKAARQMLKDKSLVVRTAAVQTIEEIGSREELRVLWSALNDPKNFRKGKSLWIRAHIMRAIAKNVGAGDEVKLAQFVNDKDPQVQLWSLYGLEKASGTRKQNKGLSLAQRKQKWTAWASKKKQRSKNLF